MDLSLTKMDSFSMKDPYTIPKSELVLQFLNKGGVFRYNDVELCLSDEDKLCAIEIEDDEEVLYEFHIGFNNFVGMCNEITEEVRLHMFLFIQEPRTKSDA